MTTNDAPAIDPTNATREEEPAGTSTRPDLDSRIVEVVVRLALPPFVVITIVAVLFVIYSLITALAGLVT